MKSAPTSFFGFLGRFTVVHVVTYSVFGMVFFSLMGYAEHFASPALACFMRPTDSPWVMAGPLFQLVRGPVLALAFFPFHRVILEGRWGWLKLWFALWILTGIGAVAAGLGTIEGIVYTKAPLQLHLIGFPEVILQMLAFSYVFYTWERRKEKKVTIPLVAVFIVIVAVLLMGILVTTP